MSQINISDLFCGLGCFGSMLSNHCLSEIFYVQAKTNIIKLCQDKPNNAIFWLYLVGLVESESNEFGVSKQENITRSRPPVLYFVCDGG